MNYKHVSVIITSILVMFFANSTHQSFGDGFEQPHFKWSHKPTICAFEPHDPQFPNLSWKMFTETQNALVDWKAKLSGGGTSNAGWNMDLVQIPLSKVDSYDQTNCDITINYKPKPDNPAPNYYETGVTYFADFPKVHVTIYYLGAQFDTHKVEFQNGGTWYYRYDTTLTYNNYFATDPQLQSTIRHELGHAMGLGHYLVGGEELYRINKGFEDAPSIMVGGGLIDVGATHYDITPLDVTEIKSIYGYDGFPIPQTILTPVQNPTVQNTANNSPQVSTNNQERTQIIIPSHLPSWIKNNAKWWSESKINDTEFVNAMQYLIKLGILHVQNTSTGSASSQSIPAWVPSNAGLWADGKITDYEFLRGLQYLIGMGIIKI